MAKEKLRQTNIMSLNVCMRKWTKTDARILHHLETTETTEHKDPYLQQRVHIVLMIWWGRTKVLYTIKNTISVKAALKNSCCFYELFNAVFQKNA